MPLERLIPTILSMDTGVDQEQSPTTETNTHPLHGLIRTHLLTPRLITEKYYKRISALVGEEDSDDDRSDDELMWFALKHEKLGLEDDNATEEEQVVLDERWKRMWLARMEQRE